MILPKQRCFGCRAATTDTDLPDLLRASSANLLLTFTHSAKQLTAPTNAAHRTELQFLVRLRAAHSGRPTHGSMTPSKSRIVNAIRMLL